MLRRFAHHHAAGPEGDGPSEVERVADTHGQFVWYELMTTDVRTAEVFYAKVVGWTPEEAQGGMP